MLRGEKQFAKEGTLLEEKPLDPSEVGRRKKSSSDTEQGRRFDLKSKGFK